MTLLPALHEGAARVRARHTKAPPHHPRCHLQPSDTVLAGPLAGPGSASRLAARGQAGTGARGHRTCFQWAPRPRAWPLPLTTVPAGPAWLPSTLAFKYVQNPRIIFLEPLAAPLPALNPWGRGPPSLPQSCTPFPPNGPYCIHRHLYVVLAEQRRQGA